MKQSSKFWNKIDKIDDVLNCLGLGLILYLAFLFVVCTSGDIKYAYCGGGQVTVVGYEGNDRDLTIPETISCFRVTSIEDGAFSNCDSLRSITIPKSVVSIGNEAFFGCKGVTLVAEHNSYAEEYVIHNGIAFLYPEFSYLLPWLP